MAFDLFWRKLTIRNFGRGPSLTKAAAPPTPPAAGLSQATVLEEALRKVTSPYRGISVARQGRGAMVSKRWLW